MANPAKSVNTPQTTATLYKILHGIAKNVVEAQSAMDMHVLELLKKALAEEPTLEHGDGEYSLMDLGFEPCFFAMPRTDIEVSLSVQVVRSFKPSVSPGVGGMDPMAAFEQIKSTKKMAQQSSPDAKGSPTNAGNGAGRPPESNVVRTAIRALPAPQRFTDILMGQGTAGDS